MVEPQVFSNAYHLNHLIKVYGYKRYLEIGVCGYQEKSRAGATWHDMRVVQKDGVDPMGEPANYHMTSDDFFANIADDDRWDIIFIDGDHGYKQVVRDLDNSLKHLADGGLIVMHDVYPHPNLVAKGPPFPKAFSEIWCAIADFSLTREDLYFSLVEIPVGRAIAIVRKVDHRTIPKVRSYNVGHPLNWVIVTDMKHRIFDEVLDNDKFLEVFNGQKRD